MSTRPPHWLQQAMRFGLVGLTTLVLDYLTYRGLLLLDVPISPAKAGGFVVGTTAAYLLNRWFTFAHPGGRRPVLRFLVLYAATLVLNVVVNAVGVAALDGVSGQITLAFLVAQAVTSAANFLGLRWYVFPHRPAAG